MGNDEDGRLEVEIWQPKPRIRGRQGEGLFYPTWVDKKNKTRIASAGKKNEKKWLWQVDPDQIQNYGFKFENRTLPADIVLDSGSDSKKNLVGAIISLGRTFKDVLMNKK